MPFNNGSEYIVLKKGCRVGYLKLDVARANPAHYFSDLLAEVMEIFGNNKERMIRHFSYSYCGIARIEVYPDSFTKSFK